MQKVSFSVLKVNADLTEGRGPMRDFAYFRHRHDAESVCADPRYYKRHGVMGTPCNVQYDVEDKDIIIYDSAAEFWEKNDTETIKAKALQKLTTEEKKALGLIN